MFGKFKKTIEKGAGFETMPVPKIEITRERGLEFGERLINEGKWNENREALLMLSAIYDHPEWKKDIIGQIKKNKEFIENPEELCDRVLSDIKKAEEENDLPDLNSEIERRNKLLPIYREKIKNLVNYFRPNRKTSNIENVRIVAADTIIGEESGYNITSGTTSLIVSKSKNTYNLEHEFLHGIVNPITEKIGNELSEEDKEKLVKLAGDKLKKQGYTEPINLLNEEIIRTYNEFIETDKSPVNFDNFKKIIDSIKDEDFSIVGGENIKRFEELNIKSASDLRSKSRDYYERFFEDKLGERVYGLHLEYKKKIENDKNLSFEKYFLENFRKILD